ncbi:gamma-glutamyl-gamma-aminobutyrate hydrolase family protein [Candidatus Sumerlaeota bacterium]|nr:gamma-glutamyl-gamma-aminobutyrate hydrolase family protein [Candidatus Sumerlaeota bacterium]
MSPARPVIGINTTMERDAEGSYSATRSPYWQAIVAAGGLPILLPQISEREIIHQALAGVQGFMLIGGYDVRGERFGEKTLPTVVKMEEEREETDFALVEALIETGTPTLALCLGFQELNIARGGGLYQDLLFDGPETRVRHYDPAGGVARHGVEIAAGSRLAGILEMSGQLEVNSTHHQAIGTVGKGLTVTARAEDGIVEGLQLDGHPFFLGVQWHPEQMADSPVQARLFHALVEQARSNRAELAGI